MMATGSSRDVSATYFALLLHGFSLWVGYGFRTHDLVLAVPNALSAVVAVVVLLAVGRHLRHRP